MTTTDKPTTLITPGPVRFCWPFVFEKAPADERLGQKEEDRKFKAQILIPKTDVKTVTAIKNATEAAIHAGLTKFWKGIRPVFDPKKCGLRDGDIEKPNNPIYKGMYFLNVSNKFQPQVVKKVPGIKGLVNITDPVDFYSGCWGHLSVEMFPYNTGGAGISASMGNIMKVENVPGLDDSIIVGGQDPEAQFSSFIQDDDDIYK